MVQHIHICPVGFYPEPILEAVGGPLPADKYYFLYNNHEQSIQTLERVRESLETLGQKDIYDVEIDPFDYSSTITAIMRIHHDEMRLDPESRFYINFTSGTNIVAGACCSASYFIGATLYYVINKDYAPGLSRTERIRVIKTPRIPDVEKMKPFAKDLLLRICQNEEGVTIPDLTYYLESSAQKINHHVNAFIESGLVVKEKNGRNVILKGTEQGRMMCTWISENGR